MANYVVSDTNLTAVANAIRSKTGGTSQITFPTGFVNEISSISVGGIDLSPIKQSHALNNIGSFFTALEEGTWDYLELSVVSGTNPIVVDFGGTIKGFIHYPKNLSYTGSPNAEADVFGMSIFDDPDENGSQTANNMLVRAKGTNGSQATLNSVARRISSWTMTNGVLSMVPSYPTNANYHPFRFNTPYIFVYWWEEEE